MTVKPMLVTVLGMVPLVVVGWLLMPRAVAILLPKYVGGVPAIRWWLLPSLLTCFTPINSVLIVVRRQGIYAAAMLAGMGAYLVSMWWLVHGGAGLVAFPQAMLVGRTVFVAACWGLILHLRRLESARTEAC